MGFLNRPDTPGVIAPPPLIPAAWIAAGIFVQRKLPLGPWWPDPVSRAGLALAALAGLLALWSLLEFGRWKTSPEPWNPTTSLIDSGPFRFSRNPIYVAFLTAHLGLALYLSNPWILVAWGPAFWMLRQGIVLREERYLRDKFGEDYEQYWSRVRRWL